jgi:hypothetical protein
LPLAGGGPVRVFAALAARVLVMTTMRWRRSRHTGHIN